jgi:hypothetical protein
MKSLLIVAALFLQGAPPQSGVITGRLLTVNGIPSSSTRVVLVAADKAKGVDVALISVTRTDNEGRYRLDGVPPGRYLIMAGSLDRPTFFPGVPFETQATAVTVTDRGVVNGVDFGMVIAPPLAVAGRVLHNSNPTVLGTSKIVLTGGGESFTAAIAVDGSFRFPDIRPGAYKITIPGGGVILSDDVVTVTDHDVKGLELAVVLCSARIRLTEPAVTSIEIQRNESGSGKGIRVDINKDGVFEFSGLPGSYVVTVALPYTIPLPDIPLSLPSSPFADMQIVVPRLRPVTVHAAMEGGAAPPPYLLRIEGTVSAQQQTSPTGVTQTRTPQLTVMGVALEMKPASDGSVQILLPEGRYKFGAGSPEGAAKPLQLKSIQNGNTDLQRNDLSITPAGTETIEVRFD